MAASWFCFDLESGSYTALSRQTLALPAMAKRAILFAESRPEGVLLRKLWAQFPANGGCVRASRCNGRLRRLVLQRRGGRRIFCSGGKTLYRIALAQGGTPEIVRGIPTESYSRNVPCITSDGYLITADYAV